MAAEATAADRAAILAVLADQEAAWARGDAAGFAAHTTDDVVFTNVVGMFSVGRAPFIGQHAHIFSTIYKGSRMTQELVHIALVRPDVAVVDTLTKGEGMSHIPPGGQLIDGAIRTRLEQVMVREGGAWRVAAFHNVFVQPNVGPAGPPAT